MYEDKKIAVLMSVYNGGKYLSEQIASIAKQTLVNQITLYIRDDGSTDDSIEIINSWKDRIQIILFLEPNVGPANSFWKLFNKNIDADYFLFCDQDDVWDSNKVEISVKALNNSVCLCYCNCRYIDSNGKIMRNRRLDSSPDISYNNLFITGVTQGCSMCFTKELRDFILSKSISCIPMHDIIVMLYAKTFGKLMWIDQPLFSYRIHNDNVVARDGKIINRIRKTMWNWQNSKKHSMSTVASELIRNFESLKKDDFLRNMSVYKSSISAKRHVLNNDMLPFVPEECRRSYIIRVLLNLF